MRKILRVTAKIFLSIFATILIVVAVVLLVIRLNSNERPDPIVDSDGNVLPNSIAVIEDKAINKVPQRLTIRGNDVSNPVLLRVHGGPGEFHMPQFYRLSGNDLEDLFTVCYWDQRGSGPAYNDSIPTSSINLNQIVDDGIAVAEYLKAKFGKEKIYIEGISWGTVVSAFMVKKKPELFKAYIGVGQAGNALQNETLSYNYVLNEARKRNDISAIKELESIGSPPYKSKDEATNAIPRQRKYVVKYSSTRMPFSNTQALKTALLYDGWSMGFKYKLMTQGQYGISAPILWKETMTDLDMSKEMPEWTIPVYIIQGELDHFAETSVAKAYFDSLTAPKKEFFLLKNTGHFASAENSKRYREIIENVVLNEKETIKQ
ncbi:MAG: alpha/beta hydrolase [Pyrinomonadaceae bacterium]